MRQSATSGRSVRAVIKGLVPRPLLVQTLNPRGNNCVLLTFDDGPHPSVTPAVLDRLDAHGARAVFFVIGHRIERAPHLLNEIRRRGHVVANHSYFHRASDVLPGSSRPRFFAYYQDSKRCQAMIEPYVSGGPRLFRAPGGRMTPTTLLVPKLLGLQSVGWSVDVGDWAFRTPEQSSEGAAELLRTTKPGDIVLLHDDNAAVLDVLDTLLPELVRRQHDLASGIACL